MIAVVAFVAPLIFAGAKAGLIVLALIGIPAAIVVARNLDINIDALRNQRAELAEAEQEAQLQAHIDPLTGLGNFRMLWSSLEAQVSRARRHNERFSLILLDLDRFKEVNDYAGHREGDATLKLVGRALSSALRAEDVCCRHGGDEFTVIAIGTDHARVGVLAARLVAAIEQVPSPLGPGAHLGATAGWSTFDGHDSSPERLMQEADSMLRRRKYGLPHVPGAPASTPH